MKLSTIPTIGGRSTFDYSFEKNILHIRFGKSKNAIKVKDSDIKLVKEQVLKYKKEAIQRASFYINQHGKTVQIIDYAHILLSWLFWAEFSIIKNFPQCSTNNTITYYKHQRSLQTYKTLNYFTEFKPRHSALGFFCLFIIIKYNIDFEPISNFNRLKI
jgi:hypothetical protein